MLNKQSGLALITVLIFLQIMAILGLYAVESAIEAEKMSYLDWEQTNNFVMTESILNSVEVELIRAIPACVIPLMAQSDLLAEPLIWWQSSVACAGQLQGFSYYYVIEKLGADPCADISDSKIKNRKNSVIEYLRITLLVLDKKEESKEFLQSTILALDNATPMVCDGLHHHVIWGQQMWREPR